MQLLKHLKLGRIVYFILLLCMASCADSQVKPAPPPVKKAEKKSVVNKDIPAYVLQTLVYIRKYDKAPDGFVGGRKFQNREKRLPVSENGKRIFYREWDVKQKIKGRNRGAERLITSKDKAYYTKDHYRNFQLIHE